MRRAIALLLVLLAVVLGLPAYADMYQDARNATLPAAMANLAAQGIDLSAVTVKPALTQSPGSMTGFPAGWWTPGWWGSFSGYPGGGQNAQFLFGSYANPITTAGPPVAIGSVTARTVETCNNNSSNTGCNAALLVQNMGTAATTMVTSGITAYAETKSTAGLSIANAQAGNFIAVASAGSQTGAMGIYSVGQRLSNTSFAYGAEISASNQGTNDCGPASYTGISPCDSIWLATRGPTAGPIRKISSALHIGLGNLYGLAREGITINNASVDEKTINDQSGSDTVLNIGGTHIHGIYAEANAVTNNTFNDLSSSLRSINISGTHSEAAIWVRQGAGFFGLNVGVAPAALFHMGGTVSLPFTPDGILIRQASGGVTDTSSSGAVATEYPVNILKGTTLSATNATTYARATALHIGKPLPGANVTLTTAFALTTEGDVDVNGTVTASSFITPAGTLGVSDATAPRVVYYGDSLTNGKYDQYITLTTYNSGFTASSGPVLKTFSTQRSGYGGLMASTGLTYAPEFLDPYYQSRSPLNIAMIWLGSNDIALGAATPATTWTRIQSLAAAAKAKGFKVCVGTSISRGPPPAGGWDTSLTTLNGLIVAGWAGAGINCLVNFASDPNLAPNGSNYSNLTYYNADQVHLNEAGKQLAAAVAQAALNTYIATFTGPTVAAFNAPGSMTASGLPTSAGGGGLYLCVDSTGVMYKKATCP